MAGRPREFDEAVVLSRIKDVFWRYGFDGTKMVHLLEAASLSSASLYGAFGSKSDMYKRAIGNYLEQEGSFLVVAMGRDGDTLEAVQELLFEAIDLFTARYPVKGCMIVTSGPTDRREFSEISEWLSKLRSERNKLIVERFETAKRTGELRPGADSLVIAAFVATVLQGISIQAEDNVPRDTLLRVAMNAVQYLRESEFVRAEQ